eukprot:159097_1
MQGCRCLIIAHSSFSRCLSTISRHSTTANRLKNLFTKQARSNEDNKQIIENAWAIYKETRHGIQDADVINIFLKLCLRLKQPHVAHRLWNDIKNINHRRGAKDMIMYSLLFKCCVESKNISKSMAVLIIMNHARYQFKNNNEAKDHATNITKLIKQCSVTSDTKTLQQIQQLIQCTTDSRINQNIYIKTEFIRQFAHHNLLKNAQHIFESISRDKIDIIIVTTMMKALVHNKRNKEALQLYEQYDALNDDVSHMLAIQACINMNDMDTGKTLHAAIDAKHYTIQLYSTLIEFYGHFGDITTAFHLFESMITDAERDSVCVNGMMNQLLKNGFYEQCVELYEKYQSLNNEVSHLLALKACISLDDFAKCKDIELKINASNSKNMVGRTAIIDFYSHFGDIDAALNVFCSMNINANDPKCIETVNAMITGYIKNGCHEQALALYHQYSLIHDDISHLLALKSMIQVDDFESGRRIYDTMKHRSDISNALQSVLIEYYSHFGEIQTALDIFNAIAQGNVTNVNVAVMMKALLNNGHHEEALALYDAYDRLNENASHLQAIKACIACDNYQKGQEIHWKLKDNDCDNYIRTALLEMYGHFGDVDNALQLFNSIDTEQKDIVTYNAMIHAYGKNGELNKAKNLFHDIPKHKEKTERTYIALMNACSHCGDMAQAERIWMDEMDDDEIKYNEYVVASLVDCFGRSGALDKADDVIHAFEANTNECNQIMWMSLLSHCRNYNDKEKMQCVYNRMKERFASDTSYMATASLLLPSQTIRNIRTIL